MCFPIPRSMFQIIYEAFVHNPVKPFPIWCHSHRGCWLHHWTSATSLAIPPALDLIFYPFHPHWKFWFCKSISYSWRSSTTFWTNSARSFYNLLLPVRSTRTSLVDKKERRVRRWLNMFLILRVKMNHNCHVKPHWSHATRQGSNFSCKT